MRSSPIFTDERRTRRQVACRCAGRLPRFCDSRSHLFLGYPTQPLNRKVGTVPLGLSENRGQWKRALWGSGVLGFQAVAEEQVGEAGEGGKGKE